LQPESFRNGRLIFSPIPDEHAPNIASLSPIPESVSRHLAAAAYDTTSLARRNSLGGIPVSALKARLNGPID